MPLTSHLLFEGAVVNFPVVRTTSSTGDTPGAGPVHRASRLLLMRVDRLCVSRHASCPGDWRLGWSSLDSTSSLAEVLEIFGVAFVWRSPAKREEVYAASQFAAFIVWWQDCEELEPKPKET